MNRAQTTTRRHALLSLLRAPLAVALLLGLAAGCGDFDPASYLQDLRVLALVAQPPEVGPGDATTVTPHVYLPADQSVTAESWSFCPYTLGPAQGYACAAPECELPLTPDTGGAVSLTPYTEALSCVAALVRRGVFPGSTASPDGGTSSQLPETVETVVRYVVTASGGTTRTAVLRLPLWTQKAPASPNRNPVIQWVEIEDLAVKPGDTLAAVKTDQELTVRTVIDEASLDSYTDATGRTLKEDPVISVYATAGRFKYEREGGTNVTSTWKAEKLEENQTEARIYIVARDLRGGQAITGPYIVPIQQTTP